MAARWMPILGLLAVLAFAPGVLGHHCTGGDNPSTPPTEGQFSTLSAPTPPSPIAVVLLIVLPVGVIGGTLAIARNTTPALGVTGKWVAGPDRWVWVPDKK